MDDFHDGIDSLRIVFEDINRVNRVLGGTSITVKAVSKLMEENYQESYTIIDMGCGDGNMLRQVALYCRQNQIEAKLIGVDLNEQALILAKEASIGFQEIDFLHQDILELDATKIKCDILLSTLTMHHFNNEKLPAFLRKLVSLGKLGVVINDLHRSLWAYYFFKCFSLIFIKTKVAKIDGLISISSGFIKPELLAYAENLPSVTHEIKWKWAFRYVWIMQPIRLSNHE